MSDVWLISIDPEVSSSVQAVVRAILGGARTDTQVIERTGLAHVGHLWAVEEARKLGLIGISYTNKKQRVYRWLYPRPFLLKMTAKEREGRGL